MREGGGRFEKVTERPRVYLAVETDSAQLARRRVGELIVAQVEQSERARHVGEEAQASSQRVVAELQPLQEGDAKEARRQLGGGEPVVGQRDADHHTIRRVGGRALSGCQRVHTLKRLVITPMLTEGSRKGSKQGKRRRVGLLGHPQSQAPKSNRLGR